MALKTRRTVTTATYSTTNDNTGINAPRGVKATYQVLADNRKFRKVYNVKSKAPGVEGEAVALGGQNGYFAKHAVTGWHLFVVCTGASKGVWAQVDSEGWPYVEDWRFLCGAR